MLRESLHYRLDEIRVSDDVSHDLEETTVREHIKPREHSLLFSHSLTFCSHMYSVWVELSVTDLGLLLNPGARCSLSSSSLPIPLLLSVLLLIACPLDMMEGSQLK